MNGLIIGGLEEFQEKLKLVEKKAPDRILDKLDEGGKKLQKQAKANTPKKTGNLRKGIKLLPVVKVRGGYQKGLTNESPHFHLVERGHIRMDRNGNEIGYVHGKFYLEKTVLEMENEWTNNLKNWLDELFEELK